MDILRNRNVRWVLLATVLGAGLRLVHFDLMEFKYDEVEAIRLTRSWLDRGQLPRSGMLSGVGIRNAPGLPQALMPVVACSNAPLAVGLWVVAWNLLTIPLLYRVGVELGRPRAGAWAAALFAVHPWLNLYARKIWAQSLLPLPVTLLLLAITRCARRPRSAAAAAVAPLAALIWQLHYSGYAVLFLVVAWTVSVLLRRRVNVRLLAAGALAALVLLTPYFLYLASGNFSDLTAAVATGDTANLAARALHTLGNGFRTAFAAGMAFPFLTGPAPLWRVVPGMAGALLGGAAELATVIVCLAALAGILLEIRPAAGADHGSTGHPGGLGIGWLAALAILPAALYVPRGIDSPPHYFIVGLPALLLLAGIGLDALQARADADRPAVVAIRTVAVGTLAAGVAVWLTVLALLSAWGGAPGDYGIAYRVQARAARTLAAAGVVPENLDAHRVRDGGVGVRYLLEQMPVDAAASAGRRAVLATDWRGDIAACDTATGWQTVRHVPLVICLEPVP